MKTGKHFICLLTLLAMMVSGVGATAVAPTSAPTDIIVIGGSPQPDARLNGPSYVEEVVILVNQARWDNGQLPPLKGVGLLHNSSQTHSENMAVRDFFAHCDLDTGTSPWDRMVAAGYSWNSAGENIAAGYSTPTAVMNGWMNSTGHRNNILSTNFREIGVGYHFQSNDQGNVRLDANSDCVADTFNRGPYYRYWTQNFGRRNIVYPVVINREAYETTTPQVSLYQYGQGWAVEMRFRNEEGAWSAWQPYTANVSWTLSNGNGLKTVQSEIRNGSGEVRSASDTILLNSPVVDPLIGLAPAAITVLQEFGNPDLPQVPLQISNGGTETLNWSIAAQPAVAWLSALPGSGSTGGGQTATVTVALNPQGLAPGQYTTQLQVTGNATNSPQAVSVTLVIIEQIHQAFLPMLVRN